MLGKAKLAPGHVAICRRLRCPNSLSRVLSIRNFNSMDSQFGQRRGEKSYQLGNPMDSVKWSGGNPGNPESQHHMHRGSCYWGPATQFQLATEHGSSVTRSELEISIFARNFSGYQVLDPCGQITQACRTTLSLLQSTTHQFENSGLGKFVSGTCNRNSLMIHMGCQILQEKEASAEMRRVFRGIQWNALFYLPFTFKHQRWSLVTQRGSVTLWKPLPRSLLPVGSSIGSHQSKLPSSPQMSCRHCLSSSVWESSNERTHRS